MADALDKLGYGGDLKPVLITYLAATSRLLAMTSGTMPVHLLLTGSSSLGKSYVLDVVKRLLPEEAYHSISAGSPRTLIYDDFDLKHRVIEFGEADSLPAGEDNPAASAIRNLLQDHALNYDVTIRDKETGDYTVRKVRKPGPTVLITTSVRSLGAQLMTRLFTLEISASKEQTKAVLKTRARIAFEGGTQSPDNALITFQEYLQAKVPIKVAVPFVFELAEAMGKMTLTSTSGTYRDFERLLSFVRSVAILRQHHRQIDSDGRIVATLADYNTARELVNDMYVDSSTGITDDVRQLVEAVRELEGQGRITNARLAKHLDISVMQASRRARKALGQDWIINNERRKYHPADYAPGEPMPEAEGLPILILRDEDEGGDQVVNTVNIVNSKAVNAFSFKSGTVNTLTPITDDGTPPNIPCIKDGLGICILRTDDSKLFQCGENPKRCQFKKVDALRTCFACGSTDFWARPDGGLVCSWCHPKV
ncbi:MAG: hypothetical protein DDT34_02442 [Firmicutes bacterium]|nr:hypothetical protein [Bacillota bacterium]